jgi:hypothetical protein
MIKPCPFCGETNVQVRFVQVVILDRFYAVDGFPDSDQSSESDVESESDVSGVMCAKCHSERYDLRYNHLKGYVTSLPASEYLPDWYAALPEWHDKIARAE